MWPLRGNLSGPHFFGDRVAQKKCDSRGNLHLLSWIRGFLLRFHCVDWISVWKVFFLKVWKVRLFFCILLKACNQSNGRDHNLAGCVHRTCHAVRCSRRGPRQKQPVKINLTWFQPSAQKYAIWWTQIKIRRPRKSGWNKRVDAQNCVGVFCKKRKYFSWPPRGCYCCRAKCIRASKHDDAHQRVTASSKEGDPRWGLIGAFWQ